MSKLIKSSNNDCEYLNEINKLANSITQQWKEVENLIGCISNYWKGEASFLHNDYYMEMQETAGELIDSLKDNTYMFLKSQGYEISKNISNVKTLPTDFF